MIEASITSPWVGDGKTTETAYRPKLIDDFRLTLHNITGNPRSGSAVVKAFAKTRGEMDAVKRNRDYVVVDRAP